MATSSSDAPIHISTGSNKSRRAKCSFTGCGKTKSKFPHLHFFRFPVNRPDICKEWITNCANEALDSLTNKTLLSRVVCENHFKPECFTSTLRTYLRKNAVPTILGCVHIPDSATESTYTSEMVAENLTVAIDSQQLEGSQSPTHTASSLQQGSPQTPTTPKYKKYTSCIGRIATPQKQLTPTKRKLLAKLSSSQKIKKRLQQRAKRLEMRQQKLSKEELIEEIKQYLPTSVSNFVAMQLNHAGIKSKIWSEVERQIALSMSYKSPR